MQHDSVVCWCLTLLVLGRLAAHSRYGTARRLLTTQREASSSTPGDRSSCLPITPHGTLAAGTAQTGGVGKEREACRTETAPTSLQIREPEIAWLSACAGPLRRSRETLGRSRSPPMLTLRLPSWTLPRSEDKIHGMGKPIFFCKVVISFLLFMRL